MAMRVGAENKTKLYSAIGLGVVVLLLAARVLFSYFGTSTPASAPPPVTAPAPVNSPTSSPAAPRAGANAPTAVPFAHEAAHLPSSSAFDPTLHPEVMAQAESTSYTGAGRNIFSANSVAPPPVIEKPQAFRPSAPAPPPGPPPPPAIDLKFYGYATARGTQRQVFLLHGDDIFLAHEGDVVDRRYRVVSIRPMSVDIEDIPYHNTQSLPLTQN